MIQCGNCGIDMEEGVSFCPMCGSAVEAPPQQAQPGSGNPAGTGCPPPPSAAPNPAPGPNYAAPPNPAHSAPPYPPAAPNPHPPYAQAPNQGWQAPPAYAAYAPAAPAGGSGNFFLENIVGLIPWALVLLVMLVLLVAGGGNFFDPLNFRNIFQQTMTLVPMAVGVVLTVRARGLDFSLAFVVTLTGFVWSASGSPVLALFAAVAAGALNGLLIAVLRLPSVMVSLVVSALIRGIALMGTDAMPVMMEITVESHIPLALVLALLALAGGFVYNCFTPLGKPAAQRAQSKGTAFQFLAYPLAALLAGFTGILMVMRMRAFAPTMAGDFYFVPLVLIWAAVSSTKLADNRFVPVLYGAVVIGLYSILSNLFNLLGVDAYIQMLANSLLTLFFLVGAGFARLPAAKRDSSGMQ